MKKKFYRVQVNKILCGVCTGVAEYFDIDVTIVRILWAMAVLLGGSGILLYIVIALIAPMKPIDYYPEDPNSLNNTSNHSDSDE